MTSPDATASLDKNLADKNLAQIDHFTMSFGKFKGHLVRKIPDLDADYAEWLLAQPWFRQRFRAAYQVLSHAMQAHEERYRIEVEQYRREQEARRARNEQERLDGHKVVYDQRGIMPFGKYKGLPLAIVARDKRYRRWFLGSTYAQMNPELAADIAALDYSDVEALGCTVIAFPVARIVSRPRSNDPPEAA
jgi:uncharacterized protein (DUF3820 family)